MGVVRYWIDGCTTTQQHTCVPHPPLTSHHTTTQPTQTAKQTSAEEAGGAGEVRVQDPPGVRALLAGRTGACLARLLGPCVDVWIRGGCIVRRAGRRQHQQQQPPDPTDAYYTIYPPAHDLKEPGDGVAGRLRGGVGPRHLPPAQGASLPGTFCVCTNVCIHVAEPHQTNPTPPHTTVVIRIAIPLITPKPTITGEGGVHDARHRGDGHDLLAGRGDARHGRHGRRRQGAGDWPC